MADIEDYLLIIEQEIQGGKKLILGGGNVAVNPETILNAVSGIRDVLPDVIREARQIVNHSEKIMDDSLVKAQGIVEDARRRAAELVDRDNIIASANKEAEIIKAQALDYKERVYEDVRNSVNAVLDSVDGTLNDVHNKIMQAKADNNRS